MMKRGDPHGPARSLVALSLAALVWAGVVHAKPYVDTKKRFSLDLPSGWALHPIPGDTSGMTFKKDAGGAFALMRVVVRETRPQETVDETLAEATRRFEQEIGFDKSGPDLPVSVGLMSAASRSFTVFASGDKATVRAIDLYAMHAFGHAHVIQLEALDKERSRFMRDFDDIIASYSALVGRKLYAPLIARWDNVDDGPPLVLDENGTFTLGPLLGTYHADGGKLSLEVDDGKETYRYALKDNRLTLRSENLDAPMVFERSGASRFTAEDAKPAPVTPLTRDDVIGRWRAVDVAASEPLVLHLARTGSVQFGPLSGQWKFRRGLLTISSTAGKSVTYTISRAQGGRKIVLGGGDLEKDVTFERE